MQAAVAEYSVADDQDPGEHVREAFSRYGGQEALIELRQMQQLRRSASQPWESQQQQQQQRWDEQQQWDQQQYWEQQHHWDQQQHWEQQQQQQEGPSPSHSNWQDRHSQPPPPPPRHGSDQHWEQQQQQQPQQQRQPPPLCGPEWWMVPMMLLPELPLRGQQYLRPDPPMAVVGTSLVVKLFPLQARHRVRNRKPPSLVTILGSMTRKGLTRPNSTQVWAACHQYRKTDGTLLMTVADTPAAQAAAREAVAAGHVTVGDGDTAILVPVSWAPTTQPAGCTVVTLHQLPPQYAREKVGTTLLAAAQQQGKVVAEFLGGSALMGDAQLTCPAADTVVLWVRPPPDDPLLTRLPTSFDSGVPGSPPVRIEVAGRPSLAPHTWPQLTQQLLRRKQLTLDSIYEDGDAAADTPPSNHQRQQQQQQQQQQQPQTRPQQQRAEPQQSPAPLPPARQQQSEGGAATDMQVDSQPEPDAAGLPDDPSARSTTCSRGCCCRSMTCL